jgi:hypothetical protein
MARVTCHERNMWSNNTQSPNHRSVPATAPQDSSLKRGQRLPQDCTTLVGLTPDLENGAIDALQMAEKGVDFSGEPVVEGIVHVASDLHFDRFRWVEMDVSG